MIKVTLKEIENSKRVEFDIYNHRGKVICKKGTLVTPGLILQLSNFKLFKNPEEAVLEEPAPEKPPQEEEKETPSEAPPVVQILDFTDTIQEAPEDFKTAISPDVREAVLTSTRDFMKEAQSGKPIELQLAEETRDRIVAEVATKIEDVNYLGELRVFDEYTYSHNVNVSALSVALGIKLNMRDADIRDMALATLLHDLGKMKIPKEILNKPGKLNDKEFAVMKLHPQLGFKMITEDLKLPFKISRVALEHQEKFGGGGYPRNVNGNDTAIFSQICTICDVYDALVSKRPYKEAKSTPMALKIMLSEGSKSFNPALLNKFVYMTTYGEK